MSTTFSSVVVLIAGETVFQVLVGNVEKDNEPYGSGCGDVDGCMIQATSRLSGEDTGSLVGLHGNSD